MVESLEGEDGGKKRKKCAMRAEKQRIDQRKEKVKDKNLEERQRLNENIRRESRSPVLM